MRVRRGVRATTPWKARWPTPSPPKIPMSSSVVPARPAPGRSRRRPGRAPRGPGRRPDRAHRGADAAGYPPSRWRAPRHGRATFWAGCDWKARRRTRRSKRMAEFAARNPRALPVVGGVAARALVRRAGAALPPAARRAAVRTTARAARTLVRRQGRPRSARCRGSCAAFAAPPRPAERRRRCGRASPSIRRAALPRARRWRAGSRGRCRAAAPLCARRSQAAAWPLAHARHCAPWAAWACAGAAMRAPAQFASRTVSSPGGAERHMHAVGGHPWPAR